MPDAVSQGEKIVATAIIGTITDSTLAVRFTFPISGKALPVVFFAV
jgi:hypothetical protein